MRRAKGDLIAVFDADFVPPRDILLDTIHHFTDPRGSVPARQQRVEVGEQGREQQR